MKDKDLKYLSEHIENVIIKTVNGKIDKLDRKFDKKFKENEDKFAKQFKDHEKKMEPVFEVYDTAKRGGNFIKWFSGVILAVGIIFAAIKGYININ